MRRTSPLIVGGGPAGAAAAIALARAGTPPLLLDRNREAPDHLCGGFLGWDALAALDALGIDPVGLGARPIHRVRLIAGDIIVEAALPYRAAGLSRRTLDAALLAQAIHIGAEVEKGVMARALDPSSRTLRLGDGGELRPDALFLATGKQDLRGAARPREAGGPDPAVGLRTRLAPSPALASALEGVIELHLFRSGYAGLLLQEDGAANLCMSVARSRFAAAGASADDLLADLAESPRLLDRIGQAVACDPWQAVAAIPYGWRAQETEPGLFRLGDQAAVIASLAGDGVAIALASGRLAARYHAADAASAAPAFQRAFAATARRPLAVAGGLRRLAESSGAPPLLRLFGNVPGLAALLARATRIKQR
ncbi:MAG: monooxygenase FAD-binding protein [Sphingomonas bacterium]|nr:monooxygenase FAD-binding protein [Sphingomonas bacterium]